MNQSYLFELESHCRFPVLDGDPANDAGGPIKRWCQKIDAMDEIVKSSAKTSKRLMTRFYQRVWRNKIYPMQPLGKHKIRDHFAAAFFQMGITNWEELRPHATRSWFITTLADNPGVNHQEVRQAARHKNAATTLEYMSRGDHSEASRLVALTRNLKVPEKNVPGNSDLPETSGAAVSSVGNTVCTEKNTVPVLAQKKVVAEEETGQKLRHAPSVPHNDPDSSDDENEGVPLSFPIEMPPDDTGTPEKVFSTPPIKNASSPYTPINLTGRSKITSDNAGTHRPSPSPGYAHRNPALSVMASPDYSYLSSTLTQYPQQNFRPEEFRQSGMLSPQVQGSNDFSSYTQAEYSSLNERIHALESSRRRNDDRCDAMQMTIGRTRQSRGPSTRQLAIRDMARRVDELVEAEGRRANELRRMEERLLSATSPYRNSRQEEEDLVREYLEEEKERDERRRIEIE